MREYLLKCAHLYAEYEDVRIDTAFSTLLVNSSFNRQLYFAGR